MSHRLPPAGHRRAGMAAAAPDGGTGGLPLARRMACTGAGLAGAPELISGRAVAQAARTVRLAAAARGFTLIEVLVATGLLAAGLALAFSVVRAATAVTERGETQAARNETMRAVQGFLRTRLASAQTIAFQIDPATQAPVRFLGESTRMRFVADLPDWLGRGGPHLYDVQVAGQGTRLEVGFAVAQAGQSFQDSARAPELLADGLRTVRFDYRGLTADGHLSDWQDTWGSAQPQAQSLPVQVRVQVQPATGAAWPPLVVTLAQGNGSVGPAVMP